MFNSLAPKQEKIHKLLSSLALRLENLQQKLVPRAYNQLHQELTFNYTEGLKLTALKACNQLHQKLEIDYIDREDLQLTVPKTITLHGNNKMSITLTKNVESQYCIKHIDV